MSLFSYLLFLKYGCSAHADNRGPSPSPSPIWPGTGTLPRPRPRFAEIGDQAVVLEYPKGVEVWSHNSPQQSTLSNTFPIEWPMYVVDYGGTSDSDSERDKVPSRLPALAGSCIFA
jgi:hypothetical protein